MTRKLMPLLFLLAACEGPAGSAGSAGPTGEDGIDGQPGQTGAPGQDGTNGTDGDDGTDGDPGTPCWDLNADGVEDPEEDVNEDGAWDALDCAGVPTGTLQGVVVDADRGALIAGATVTAAPAGFEMVTGPDGEFLFEDAPFGLYQLAATAPSLVLSGNTVIEGLEVTASAEVGLLAKQTVTVKLKVKRLDYDLVNITTVHTGNDPLYTVANCKACHTDRVAETSKLDGTLPFHAMTTHNGSACTLCHSAAYGVDISPDGSWHNESAASSRKQVDVSACAGCHKCYPTDFCAPANTCPDPCP